jgi:hypothetical protein
MLGWARAGQAGTRQHCCRQHFSLSQLKGNSSPRQHVAVPLLWSSRQRPGLGPTLTHASVKEMQAMAASQKVLSCTLATHFHLLKKTSIPCNE